MGFFDKNKGTTDVVDTPPAPPVSGGVNLTKGSRVTLEKTSSGTIAVTNGWTAKRKDYDLKALVRYRDGRLIYVGAANSDEVLRTPEGAVSHGGDVKLPGDLEKITVSWHPDIASIAVSSYSALENGAGSFKEYGVYVGIENGPQVITLSAADASANGNQYTLCFGEIVFNADGTFTVTNLEMYSKGGSENRVGYKGDKVTMDIGPRGQTK